MFTDTGKLQIISQGSGTVNGNVKAFDFGTCKEPILREEQIDESVLPGDLITAQTMYRHELHQHSYFDFTEVLRAAADLLEEETRR